MANMTLARGLRERSTIRGVLATLSQRIFRSAVVERGAPVDFRADESLAEYEAKQAELRSLKTACARTSLSTNVRIPEGVPVDEAGQNVPVYQAVLIRDDLKGLRNVLSRLIATNADPQRIGGYAGETPQIIERERTYDFNSLVKRHDSLQTYIDDLDGLIQATDATTKL